MMKYLILIALFLSACGVKPNYTTKHGIQVYCTDQDRCYDKKEIEVVTDTFIDVCPDPQAMEEALQGYEIVVDILLGEDIDGDGDLDGFDCSSQTHGRVERCAGTYDSYMNNIEILYSECIATSALAHEFSHFYQYKVDKMDNDFEHEDTRFFPNGCPTKEEGEVAHEECISQTVVPVVRFITTLLLCAEKEE